MNRAAWSLTTSWQSLFSIPPPPAALGFYNLGSALKRKIKSPGEAEAELKYPLLQWESLDPSPDIIQGQVTPLTSNVGHTSSPVPDPSMVSPCAPGNRAAAGLAPPSQPLFQ